MSKPATLPVWATDGGTTLEPSAGEKAAGWGASDKPPARWMNWWQNNVYAWAQYLNGLPTDNDFRNANFTWGGSHIFSSAIQVPATDGIATVATSRTILVPLTSFAPSYDASGVPSWRLSDYSTTGEAPRWTSLVLDKPLYCCLDGFLHDGMQISAIDVIVDPSVARATAGDRIQVDLSTTAFDFTTPGLTAATVHVNGTDDGATNVQKISPAFGGSSYTTNRGTQHKLLTITSGASGSVGDHVYAARIVVTQSTIKTW